MDLTALVVGIAGMLFIAGKVTDFVKELTNLPGSRRAVVTQLLVWAAAVAVVGLYSASDLGSSIVIADQTVNDMDAATKVILGLAIGSGMSTLYDFKKAVDNTDSAKGSSLNI